MSNDQPNDQSPKTDYSANSHKAKAAAKAQPESTKSEERTVEAIEGIVVEQRKKSLGRKIAETFAGDDVNSVGQYLLFDVFIPAAKSTISDMVSQGIERFLFGESARARSGGVRTSGSRVNYGGMYKADEKRESPQPLSRRARAMHEINEYVFVNRHEAEAVIERLCDMIDQYGSASVANLYDLIGVTASFTDHKWGWTNLRDARSMRVREGYMIDLPRTVQID